MEIHLKFSYTLCFLLKQRIKKRNFNYVLTGIGLVKAESVSVIGLDKNDGHDVRSISIPQTHPGWAAPASYSFKSPPFLRKLSRTYIQQFLEPYLHKQWLICCVMGKLMARVVWNISKIKAYLNAQASWPPLGHFRNFFSSLPAFCSFSRDF